MQTFNCLDSYPGSSCDWKPYPYPPKPFLSENTPYLPRHHIAPSASFSSCQKHALTPLAVSNPLRPISSTCRRSRSPSLLHSSKASLPCYHLTSWFTSLKSSFLPSFSLKPHLSRSSMTFMQQIQGTSPEVQWLRIHLSKQGIQARSLVRELRSHMQRGVRVPGLLGPHTTAREIPVPPGRHRNHS